MLMKNTLKSPALNFYRDTVWTLFKDNAPDRISNGAPEHAKIIFQAMLHFAKNQVKIFCDNLSNEVFDDSQLVSELRNALKRNVVVSVFTQKDFDNIDFVQTLKDATNGSSIVKVSNKSLVNRKENFAVMDSSAFRYEPNRDQVKAVASANDPETCFTLLHNFNKIEQLAFV